MMKVMFMKRNDMMLIFLNTIKHDDDAGHFGG